MNETIQTAMQSYLVEALNQKTQYKTVSVSKYLDLLKLKFLGFKNEVENNVKQSPTVKETLDYLSKLQIDFQDLLMFFEGSFEILLFPNEQNELYLKKKIRITTYNKAHVLIYKMTLQLIAEITNHVKYAFEKNILTLSMIQLSKYIRKSKQCKIIDIVELGFALYHTDFFVNRTGEALQLYEFIENLGRFFGVEIKNMNHRIIELKNRDQNQYKFLEQLINSYSNSITIEI